MKYADAWEELREFVAGALTLNLDKAALGELSILQEKMTELEEEYE